MGRSVSYPCGASVAYLDLEADEGWCITCGEPESDCACACDADDRDIQPGEIDYEYYRDWLRESAMEAWPSLQPETRAWRGREDAVLCRNQLVDFGWSEYCGLAAIWLVPREGLDPGMEAFAEAWINRVWPKFERQYGQLVSQGYASNGEQFFLRRA